LLGFSTIKLLSFPLSHTVLYGRKSLYTVPCLRSRALSSTSRMFIYINYVEFSCKGYLSILPFVCLFNQFISVWVHRYLFYTLCYNLILPYLFCCSDSFALAIGSALSWVLLTYPHHCVWLFFFLTPFPYFLALEESPGSSCVFSVLVLESVISPRSPGSCY